MGEAGDRNRLQTVGEEAWIWKVMAVASNRPFTTKRDQGRGASPSRRAVLGSGTAGAGLLATGCSIFDEDATGDSGGGEEGDRPTMRIVQTSGSVETLDPHYVGNAMIIVPAGLLEGLVFQDETATDVVPAAAESWEVSEDELTYTFTMREGATWSNGDPVVAGDAEWSFQRLLDPTGAGGNYASGASSYLPGLGIKGALDYQSGALSEWDEVGISAPDDSTLVIELESPNPDFLLLMSHYSMVLVHPPSVEEDQQGWQQPENWVGNGAFVPVSWEPNSALVMDANPEYWDADAVEVGRIDMRLGSDAPTNVLAFRGGDLEIITVSGSTVQTDADLKESVVQVDGYGTTYLQAMWGGHRAIEDPRVRRALSMAVDRDALADLSEGRQPGTALIPDVVPGWSDEFAVPFDVDGAKELLEEAGLLDDMPGVRIQYNFDEPWLEVLREVWIDALGIDVNIEILESGVHSDTRWEPHDDDSVMSFYAGTFSGLPTLNNWIYNIFGYDYVRQFSLSADDWAELQAVQNDDSLDGPEIAARAEEILSTRSSDEAQEFADLVDEAVSTLDETEREAKFVQAAKVREDIAQTIPLTWNPQLWAVADDVEGVQPRPSPEGYYYKYLRPSGD